MSLGQTSDKNNKATRTKALLALEKKERVTPTAKLMKVSETVLSTLKLTRVSVLV